MKIYLQLNVFLSVTFLIQSVAIDLESLLLKIEKKVFSYQALREKPYKPPFDWYEKEGLFKSDIRLNSFGFEFAQEFRNGNFAAVYDNNMFSTGILNFFTFLLIEIYLTAFIFKRLDFGCVARKSAIWQTCESRNKTNRACHTNTQFI